MAQMNLTPLDDVLDKHFGKVGTPKRDAFESDVDEALHAYRLGEAIKKARIEQNLTQEQLGEHIVQWGKIHLCHNYLFLKYSFLIASAFAISLLGVF